MRILGITFAGSATSRRAETRAFFLSVFGFEPQPLEGFPADVFELPDGSAFGVVEVPEEMATRTIGFLVDDLDEAVAELREKGVEIGEPGENRLGRYAHFHAPDGKLYELVERPAAG